jgi:biotin synthase-related radical SAM superfamily protein
MEESPVSSIEAMSPEHLKTIRAVAPPQQSIERYWRVLRKSEDSLTSSMECLSSM